MHIYIYEYSNRGSSPGDGSDDIDGNDHTQCSCETELKIRFLKC